MFNLPIPLLLVITIISSFIISTLRGTYSKRFRMQGTLLWSFNFFQNIACFIGIFVIFIISDTIFVFSSFSVILGVILAFLCVFSLFSNLRAFSLGSFSYTAVIVSLSAIIPTLSGLFFSDTISPVQYIGISLMVVCIILSPEKVQSGEKKLSGKWLFFCATAFICTGGIGVVQKLHQSSQLHKGEMPALLLTCFFTAAVLTGIILFCEYRKEEHQNVKKEKLPKTVIIMPIVCGLCFSFPHTLNLFLAGNLPTVVLFPTINLTPMILSILYGVVVFKDRLSVIRWIGIGVGISSAILVSGIF